MSVIPVATRQWVVPHSLEHVYVDTARQGSFPRSRRNVLVAFQRQEIVKGARKPGGIVNSVELGDFDPDTVVTIQRRVWQVLGVETSSGHSL
jgi:hypothetical protein